MIRRQPTVIKLTPEDVLAYDEEKQRQFFPPPASLGVASLNSTNINQEQLDIHQPVLNNKLNASLSSLNSSTPDSDTLLQHQLRRHIKSKDERIGVSRQ